MTRPAPTSLLSRLAMVTLALCVGAGLLFGAAATADAQDTVELTMMFHGSVGGKIAPCG